ncbi:MAG: hypothetical protein ACJ708_03110 [Nitrososphaeraceae archaeon]
MEHMSSEMEQQNQHQEQQVQWRRDKVQELCSKGYNTKGDIADAASWTSYSK